MSVPGASAPSLLDRLLRPGRTSPRDSLLDLLLLTALALLLIGPGLGLREPWAPDEPRFALVAKDMLRSGDWLFPRVGGDLYADKPPVFFWLLAIAMSITGSLRAGFLLPSLLAGIGSTWLVYDLLKRVRGREVALAGAFVLLLTFQFTWQARQAQVDGVLCFFTTLSLYGLMRHLVAGPSRGWFLAGWAVAGVGVITKGVGFLPLLVLLPFSVLAQRGWPNTAGRIRTLSFAGAATALVTIGLWFVPMMIATSTGGDLLEYRNEILFEQTVTRYADAWHHNKPPWYYLVNVIPLFWLPLIALLPWLWPRWRSALRDRDIFVALLLAWVLIVVAFFSVSSGKRAVYVLPAVPALAMAAAPWLPELLRSRGPRRLAFGLAVLFPLVAVCGAAYFAIDGEAAGRIVRQFGVDPVVPLALMALLAAIPVILLRAREGWLAYAGALAGILVTIGFVVYPRIDAARSGRALMSRLEQASAGVAELGLAGWKVQYMLQLRRPAINFGQARWREPEAEAADAAAWLAQRAGRAVFIERLLREACFAEADAVDLGKANGGHWFLVTGDADPDCVARGDLSRTIHYTPPYAYLNSGS